MAEQGRLTRSESDRMLVGVCGGLGQHFGIDPTLVRVVFVLLAVFGGSGLVLYLALWLIVPRASVADAPPRDVVSDGVDEGRRLAREGADAAKRGYRRMRGTNGGPAGEPPAEGPDGATPGSATPGGTMPDSAPPAGEGSGAAGPGGGVPGRERSGDEPDWPDPNRGGPLA